VSVMALTVEAYAAVARERHRVEGDERGASRCQECGERAKSKEEEPRAHRAQA
jgi:hypothetical protein